MPRDHTKHGSPKRDRAKTDGTASDDGSDELAGDPDGDGAEGRAPLILLAEDEESFVEALVVGLGREGFQVAVARDGRDALRLFEEVDPDLVLLDLMLPKLSGIDVCRSIRALSPVPIIIVTAKGTEIDTAVALEAGADD